MQETIHKVFKIRNKETGLFSKGGTNTKICGLRKVNHGQISDI